MDDLRRMALGNSPYLMDKSFRSRKLRYLAQALLAAVTLGAVLAFEDSLTSAAIVTAIASSAYIIFTVPHGIASSPRRVIGGHGAGIAVGLAAAFVLRDIMSDDVVTSFWRDFVAAFAVGGGMLVMAATDTEHPPAAGTVLGLALGPHPLASGALVLVAALLLSTARGLLGRWLVDLEH